MKKQPLIPITKNAAAPSQPQRTIDSLLVESTDIGRQIRAMQGRQEEISVILYNELKVRANELEQIKAKTTEPK